MIPTSRLDQWTYGLDPARAARALLALGLQSPGPSQGPPVGRVPPVRTWTLSERGLSRRLDTPAVELAGSLDEASCRVAVTGDVVAIEVAQRLRAAPSVAAAFAAVRREPGSLRHRPWSWPLRIGLLGFDASEAEALTAAIIATGRLPETLVDVRRLEDEPAAVDLLVTRRALEEATPAVLAANPLANFALVLGEPAERWPVVDAQLATIRAATGAVAAALAPSDRLEQLGTLIREMSHALPIDIAAAAAWGDQARLWAEPDRLDRSLVPSIALRRTSEFRTAARVIAHAMPPEAPVLVEQLDALATGVYLYEAGEASGVAEMTAALDAALDPLEDERWLQAYVNQDAGKNTFTKGDNTVLVFVGSAEKDALHAPTPFDEHKLPWQEEDADAYRLTVVLAPLVPRGDPQVEQIELPRFGRSQTASFRIKVEPNTKTLSLRLVVLFRNRILQTALLSGRVGRRAKLVDLLAVVSGFKGLDDRSGFDAALLANHDTAGLRALLHSSPRQTKFVDNTDAVLETVKRLANTLGLAADMAPSPKALQAKRARDILVALTRDGKELNDRLAILAEARRIQVVSAGGDWFLPIELAYERDAATDGATVCPNFLNDPNSCGPACPNRLDVVCPNAFWGLSRTIERHRFDSELENELGDRIALIGLPRAKRRTLPLDRALFGASAKVKPPGLDSAIAALGLPATTATSWEEWRASLEAEETHLLVLLPHTNYDQNPTLEISTKTLHRGNIEKPYVTGGRQEINPVVVLFGCRTAGTRGDPAGFASRFMLNDAAIVIHSLSDLRASQAALMAQRWVTLLRSARDHAPISDLLTQFRRTEVHNGLLAALAVSALGDADWRL